MIAKVGNKYEIVFELEDLSKYIDRDFYDTIETLHNQQVEKLREDTKLCKEMERDMDAYYQIITSGIQNITELIHELEDMKRFNRKQLVGRLNEILNNLENY